MPKSIVTRLRNAKVNLEKTLDDCGQAYSGTDPVEDGKKIFVLNQKKKHSLSTAGELRVTELDDKVPDPYEVFGFGILAYFSTMRYLIFAFAVATALFLPICVIYSKGKAFAHMSGYNFMMEFSLGNIGQSEPVCLH